MSAPTATMTGLYYDGRVPVGSRATMIVTGREVALIGERVSEHYPLANLHVSPRVVGADRFIRLPDHGQFQCTDTPLLDRLPLEVPAERISAWLEQRWAIAVACVLVTVAVLAYGYMFWLPAAAERLVTHIPIESEARLGSKALTWLDSKHFFNSTSLDIETQSRLSEGFGRLTQGLPLEASYSLALRDSRLLGPNALALPGGTIVITDQMVKLTETPEEALAVLAHEIGHVELRHSMRHLLQDSATVAIAAAVTSDASSLSAAVAGLPALLVQMKYSREFEAEADEYAFALLKRNGISPLAFASVMERLSRHTGSGKDNEEDFAFLSTHPMSQERIAQARAAAEKP